MAEDLGEERDATVQKVVDEVSEVFKPLARREWIAWGRALLFGELREELARQQAEDEARRALEVEERVHEAAAAAKAAGLIDRRATLADARNSVLAQFRAKTLSKDELQKRNAELAAEANAIEKDEVGEEPDEDTKEHQELPTVRLRKRKAVALEISDEEEDELAEDRTDTKRAKTLSNELLDVEGPVSLRFSLNFLRFS